MQFNKYTHTHTPLIPPWEDPCEWHRITRMTGPDCAVMVNFINTHTHTRTKDVENGYDGREQGCVRLSWCFFSCKKMNDHPPPSFSTPSANTCHVVYVCACFYSSQKKTQTSYGAARRCQVVAWEAKERIPQLESGIRKSESIGQLNVQRIGRRTLRVCSENVADALHQYIF